MAYYLIIMHEPFYSKQSMDAKSVYNNKVLCKRLSSLIDRKNRILYLINSLINLEGEIMNYNNEATISLKKLDFNFFRHNLHNVNKQIFGTNGKIKNLWVNLFTVFPRFSYNPVDYSGIVLYQKSRAGEYIIHLFC